MAHSTREEIRKLAKSFLFLLPLAVLAAVKVTALLYDQRVVVIGLDLTSPHIKNLNESLNEARLQATARLKRKVGLKVMGRRAIVILPRQTGKLNQTSNDTLER